MRNLWDTIKLNSVYIFGLVKREERDKGTENTFGDIMAENCLRLVKEIEIQIQEAQWTPNKY